MPIDYTPILQGVQSGIQNYFGFQKQKEEKKRAEEEKARQEKILAMQEQVTNAQLASQKLQDTQTGLSIQQLQKQLDEAEKWGTKVITWGDITVPIAYNPDGTVNVEATIAKYNYMWKLKHPAYPTGDKTKEPTKEDEKQYFLGALANELNLEAKGMQYPDFLTLKEKDPEQYEKFLKVLIYKYGQYITEDEIRAYLNSQISPQPQNQTSPNTQPSQPGTQPAKKPLDYPATTWQGFWKIVADQFKMAFAPSQAKEDAIREIQAKIDYINQQLERPGLTMNAATTLQIQLEQLRAALVKLNSLPSATTPQNNLPQQSPLTQGTSVA